MPERLPTPLELEPPLDDPQPPPLEVPPLSRRRAPGAGAVLGSQIPDSSRRLPMNWPGNKGGKGGAAGGVGGIGGVAGVGGGVGGGEGGGGGGGVAGGGGGEGGGGERIGEGGGGGRLELPPRRQGKALVGPSSMLVVGSSCFPELSETLNDSSTYEPVETRMLGP